jgi:hypothetical protein
MSEMMMDDYELGHALAPQLLVEERLKLVRALTPQKRSTLERMCWVADELNAGRIPEGVLICR